MLVIRTNLQLHAGLNTEKRNKRGPLGLQELRIEIILVQKVKFFLDLSCKFRSFKNLKLGETMRKVNGEGQLTFIGREARDKGRVYCCFVFHRNK